MGVSVDRRQPTLGDSGPDVAVFGGGVGGLSAAHELAERGFEVTVYEKKDRLGGRSRSFPGPEGGSGEDLPAEHGFRFFPGFYQHVIDTMSRIPYEDGSVRDNLVEAPEFMQTTRERRWTIQTQPPSTLPELVDSVSIQLGGPDVPRDEKAYFSARLSQLLTSCDQRWRDHYEMVSWWDYIDADQMSDAYGKILGYGLSQVLVAVSPKEVSTRTVGRIYLQLLQGIFDPSMKADRVLNGPTNRVWFDPWREYLEHIGVELRPGATVRAIESDGEVVTVSRVVEDGREYRVDADYYVIALPIEAMRDLLTPELERAAPSLHGVHELRTAWMNGLLLYLKRDVQVTRGHVSLFDSPWALTAISQRQFWEEYDFDDFDDVEGILSVVISDWNREGVVYEKPARKCSPDQIKEEVVAQLEEHLNDREETRLSDELIEDWFLDPAIQYDSQRGECRNSESLLINTVDSLRHRPEAATDAENLVVATDYVRTGTDLATMEAANEAGRRAVNALLDRSGVDAPQCTVRELRGPPVVDRLRRLDGLLYRGRVSHPGAVTPKAWKVYGGLGNLLGR